MGKQDRPSVSNPLMEIDAALRRFRAEVRRFVAYA
jgi:hypothetical protein